MTSTFKNEVLPKTVRTTSGISVPEIKKKLIELMSCKGGYVDGKTECFTDWSKLKIRRSLLEVQYCGDTRGPFTYTPDR